MDEKNKTDEQDAPITLSDESLEQVSGGMGSGNTCPECGSQMVWCGQAVQMYQCSNPTCNYME